MKELLERIAGLVKEKCLLWKSAKAMFGYRCALTEDLTLGEEKRK